MINGWITGAHYFGDLHPKSERQYSHQRALAGVLPGYGSWMQSRAYDEQMANLRNRLGVSWANIVSPWASSLSGNMAVQSAGQMVSRNLSRLYADFPSMPSEKPPKRASFSGRYGGRHRR